MTTAKNDVFTGLKLENVYLVGESILAERREWFFQVGGMSEFLASSHPHSHQ